MFFFNELSQFLAIVSQPTTPILQSAQNNSGATAQALAPKSLTLSTIPTLYELLLSHSFLINRSIKEQYDDWRYKYPELNTHQHWAKVYPQELFDFIDECAKEAEKEEKK